MRAGERRAALRRWSEAGDRLRRRSPALYAKLFAVLVMWATSPVEEEENIDETYTNC
jgi:hypothetical protein